MREIRFRAWVKRDEWDGKHHDVAYMEDSPEAFNDPFNEHYEGNIVLMQYTGLKDVNGRDIFEGDILEYKKLSFHEDGYEQGNVVYNEYAEWAVNNWLLNKLNRKARVVGNIYEGVIE